MNNPTASPSQIRKRGIEALYKQLGPKETVRFLHELESGSGNYTTERKKWLENYTLEEVYAELQKRKRAKKK